MYVTFTWNEGFILVLYFFSRAENNRAMASPDDDNESTLYYRVQQTINKIFCNPLKSHQP